MNTGVKYPIKTSLELTETQAEIVAQIAEARSKVLGKRASRKSIHRHMVEHCATCELFLDAISINSPISTDE